MKLTASITVALMVLIVGCSAVNTQREFNHGVAAYDEEQYDAATTRFRHAAELSGDPRVFYNVGIARWKQALDEEASYEDAHQIIIEILDRDDLSDDHRVGLLFAAGDLLTKADRQEEARILFERSRDGLDDEQPYLPALRRLVSLNNPDPLSNEIRLLLAAAEDKEPDIEKTLRDY